MCGIIGYVGEKTGAKDIAINCLRKLEYRGYDSAGIALSLNNEICVYKASGKILNLADKVKDSDIDSKLAIAHTRWATHGTPNEVNAHPHKCGKVTLVHNGIIENYLEIKNELLNKGVNFSSSTDTEVACAYINYVYNEKISGNRSVTAEDRVKIIKEACTRFTGSYAFAIIFEDSQDEIYATRKNSPLIIGMSKEGNFVTSDISSVLEYTNKYIELEFDEYAVISSNEIKVYNKDAKIIEKEIKEAMLSATEYEKNGYEHYMLKEMNEQPQVIYNIFEKYINGKLFENIDFSKYKKFDIIACGSAMHAGLVGKALIEKYGNIAVNVEIASEYRYKKVFTNSDTLAMVISQSGETADTLAALKLAKKMGADTLAIVNVPYSSIAREADMCIYTNAGPEIAVATTKGYATQVAVLSCIALELSIKSDLIDKQNYQKVIEEFKSVKQYLCNLLKNKAEYEDIAKYIAKKDDLYYIGREIDYSLCMEGSLKLKEISYIHSEAYPAGELKHGTISLIDRGTPVIAIITNDSIYEKTISNVEEVKARGAYTIIIANEYKNNKQITDFSNVVLNIPDVSDFIQPLLVAVVIQYIAYEVAKIKGCDIDKPKNLAKSVTVE